MKKRLAVLFAITLCLWAVMPAKSARAADPGSRYADAFVLIEQGQAAEGKSDFATAYRSYQSALNALHSIRTDSPDWNAQMVEYRMKDCQSRFDAVKAKLPEPPPAAPNASVVTPAVQVPVVAPVPAATPPTPPPAPTVKTITADQSAKLKAQIDQLEAQNHQLKSDLTDAKRAARSSSQFDELTKENKDLKIQLAAAEKKAAAVKPVPAPVPVDSPETKKLRTDLANAHTEIDRLKKAAATPAPASSTVVASPPVVAPPADSAEMKKLRAELNKTQAEADAAKKTAAQVPDLQKQNKNLLAQLADAQNKVASAKVVAPVPVPTDTAELKKLRSDLANAQIEADKGKKASAQAADLAKQNKDLSAQLAAADKKLMTPTADPAELKKARTEADSAHADADRARKAAVDLEKQNEDLNAKLAAAEKKTNIAPTGSAEVKNLQSELDKSNAQVADLKKQVAAKTVVAPAPVGDSSEVKSLHAQLADAHKQLDQANKTASQVSDLQKQNKDLNAKLAAAAAKPVPADNSAELKKLREELDAARAEADKGKKASSQIADLEKRNNDLRAKLAAEKKQEVAASAEPEAGYVQ
jgi:DNA repair exonuclease SbcCD ATPase subunit